ncbi:S9 family peptidase [Sphingomicrobium astaxanthinifaciens]|uniref:S9 family peptidase n=1 Tax=Sphingomicrobium astaxanthinifaciens TaxID=1227949 RepID=UPI001FCC56E3|nr:S9 family peptidase [Sphingomicrobium astaxanthinifaciens]MCJ7420881.1 S9 family peptidase [Sphingomicrobium astaxanthinifaciens]
MSPFSKLLTTVAAAGLLGGCTTHEAEPVAMAPATTAQETAMYDVNQYPLIERAALFGNPERAQGRISPDGQWVSWLAPDEGVMNVWVAPMGDMGAARVVTDDRHRGISNHQWTVDSKYLLYLKDNDGDENNHVFAVDPATGATRDLTPYEGASAQLQGVSRDRPGVILVGLNDRNPQLHDLYEIDLETGERTLVLENPGYAGIVSDNLYRPRMAAAMQPDGSLNIVWLKDDLSPGELFASVPSEDVLNTNITGFSRDNNVVYMTDSRGRDIAALTAIDLTSGEAEVIATGSKADINGIFSDLETYAPIAYSSNYLKNEWTALTPEAQAELDFLQSNLAGEIAVTSRTDDDRYWVVHQSAAEAPGVYHLYDRETDTLTEWFGTRPALADAPLQPMHPLELKARDGRTLVSYLTLPPGSDADGDARPEAAVPMLLWVHGGPWARDSYGYNTIHQWMANRGYAVLSVNYRGSTGFGKEHVNAAVGEFAGKMHDDLIDAVDWAIAEGITEPDSVAIGGGSYGGYATLTGVAFTPDRFACGVDIVGPSSLVTLIESFPEYWKPFLAGTWFRYVGDPSDPEQRKDLLARSAISRVDDISVPLLIGQGGNDPRVTKQEADNLAAAMQAKGLPVTYINFPDEGHGFQKPENRLAFFAAMEGFLQTCLGGRAQPIGDAFEGSSAEIIAGAEYVDGLDAVAGGRE